MLINDNNSKTDALLLEILRWIRASSFSTVQKLVEQEFKRGSEPDLVKIKIYQMSDGSATSVGIGKSAEVSQSLVSRLWKRWRQMGLAEISEGGRTRRSFSLDAFGLPVGNTEGDDE
jgi:hypothetical protein